MNTTYTPEDQVHQLIIHASTSSAVLLNEDTFRNCYNQRAEDHRLPSYDKSTWSSEQATKSQPQVPNSGMSALDDPQETPMATFTDIQFYFIWFAYGVAGVEVG